MRQPGIIMNGLFPQVQVPFNRATLLQLQVTLQRYNGQLYREQFLLYYNETEFQHALDQ